MFARSTVIFLILALSGLSGAAQAEWKVQSGVSEKTGKRYGIVYNEIELPGPDDSAAELILDCFKGDLMAAGFAWHIHGKTDPDLFSGRVLYQFHKEKQQETKLKFRFSDKTDYHSADFPYASAEATDFIDALVFRDYVTVRADFRSGGNTGNITFKHENFDEAFEEACGWHEDFDLIIDGYLSFF